MELEHVTFTGPPLDDGHLLDRLPANLAGLLRQINGFIQFHGGLHVRGACHEPDWHSLRDAWDGEAAFWRLYPEVNQADVPFAEDCMGDQFLLRDGHVEAAPATADAGTTVKTASQLALNGPAVSWTSKARAVAVLPALTIGSPNLGGGTLSISVNAIGSGKKLIDKFKLPSFSSLGKGGKAVFANGQLTLTLKLKPGVKTSAVQAFLRKITFATQGAGLEAPTRTFVVTLSEASGALDSVTQTINVLKP